MESPGHSPLAGDVHLQTVELVANHKLHPDLQDFICRRAACELEIE